MESLIAANFETRSKQGRQELQVVSLSCCNLSRSRGLCRSTCRLHIFLCDCQPWQLLLQLNSVSRMRDGIHVRVQASDKFASTSRNHRNTRS